MDFAKRVYSYAAIYGVLVVAPLYGLEFLIVRLFGPLTQPLWYYGFLGVALMFQFIYGLIGRDPARYRPMMPLAILAKLSFGAAALALLATGRIGLLMTGIAMPDLIWVVFFWLAYRATPPAMIEA